MYLTTEEERRSTKATLHLGQMLQAQVFQLKAPVPLIIASLSLHTDRKGALNGSWLLSSICVFKLLTKQVFNRGRVTHTYRICLIQMHTAWDFSFYCFNIVKSTNDCDVPGISTGLGRSGKARDGSLFDSNLVKEESNYRSLQMVIES